jgi:hypothetical protein
MEQLRRLALGWWESYRRWLVQRAADSDPATRWMDVRLVTWPAWIPMIIAVPAAILLENDVARAVVVIPITFTSIGLSGYLSWFYMREGRRADSQRRDAERPKSD